MKLKDIRQKMGAIATQMRAINAKAEAESRGITADEEQTWNNLRADFERLEKDAERAQFDESRLAGLDEVIRRNVTDADGNQVELGREFRGGTGEPPGGPDTRGAIRFCGRELRSDYARGVRAIEPADLAPAFDQFMRRGLEGLRPEHRALIEGRFLEGGEQRAQSIGTPSAGGYTVPTDFANTVEVGLKSFSGVRNVATIMQTGDGRSLPWPTVNDTATSGALISENTGDTEGAVTFGQVTFAAYTFTSKLVLVSNELLQDSAVDIGALLGRLLGERLGRGTAGYYATGTGTSQPQGFMAGAVSGKVAASQTAVTYDEIVALKHSVDPAYRMGAKFAMNDAVLAVVKGLKDGQNRPLWQPNIAESVPATIDGDAYFIEQGMDSAMTAGKKIIAYGDFSKFVIRDVLGFQMVVLRERYAENRQVGFNMWMRTDSRLLDAGTRPLKYLALAP